ncbi:MAG TPA: hypothetical protein VKX41_04025 [Alloacidobacterium sp.]|jgi:hypothetical protein|nr:hypothetical protein [Alloacidobacterium sp.]
MQKPEVLIENWGVVEDVSSQGFAELSPGNRLVGNVLGHTRFPNSKIIYTSPILSIHWNEGRVETLNTMYRLGEINSDYKTWEGKQKTSNAA